MPGSVEIGAGRYDLTVVGPNRFLRHFTGDVTAAGRTAQAEAAYHQGGFGSKPTLVLTLTNSGPQAATFTVVCRTTTRPTRRRPFTCAHTGTRRIRWTRSRAATAGMT